MPNKDYFIYKNMFKENFTKEELHLARENGFILVGKTGSGKSTLLNVIFDKEVAEVKRSAFAVTTEPQVYYLKLKDGLCVSLVDTPGLSDPKIISKEQKLLDNIHLAKIEMAIAEENINIKGILFLVNFQLERFDESEQKALLSYNQIFPLKRFWKHLIVIFTHYYSDPNGDTVEEMRESRDESNGKLFSLLMEKVKNVSEIINYKELNIKYFNLYSPENNVKQKNQNKKNRKDLEILLAEFCQKEKLYCQIEISHEKNEKVKENGKYYLVETIKVMYYDFNNLPIKVKTFVIKKKEIVKEKDKGKDEKEYQIVDLQVYVAERDKNDNLYYTKKDKSYSKYLKTIFENRIVLINSLAIGTAIVASAFINPIFGIAGSIGILGFSIGQLFD